MPWWRPFGVEGVGLTPDLVILGNLVVDDVVYTDGSTRMAQPGGSVLYLALAARLWGLRVGVVSVAGSDYPRGTLTQLESRGIDLSGVRYLGRQGIRTWLLHEGRKRQVAHRLESPGHLEVSPDFDDIPSAWLAARAFHLAPMPRTHQAELVRRLREVNESRPRPLISLDPFDLLVEADLPFWGDLVGQLDRFFLSEDEVLTRDPDSTLAAWAERWEGLRILRKQGDRGGIVYGDGQRWRAVSAEPVDTTGAGDSFAAAFLSAELDGQTLEEGLRRGAVTASLAISGSGPEALLAARPGEAWSARSAVVLDRASGRNRAGITQ